MIKITADDLTFIGSCKEGTSVRHLYAISDQLGEAFANPDKPACNGIYMLAVIHDCQNRIRSVHLCAEDEKRPVETTLVPGTDYDMENIRACEHVVLQQYFKKG